MPLQRQRHIGSTHAAPVVDDLDSSYAPSGQADVDPLRAGIQCVLDQFLERARRPFHNLACGDAVNQVFGQAAY